MGLNRELDYFISSPSFVPEAHQITRSLKLTACVRTTVKHSSTVCVCKRKLQTWCAYTTHACQNMTAGALFGLSGSSWNRLLEIWAYLKASLVHRLLPCGQTSAAKGNTSLPGRCCCGALFKEGQAAHLVKVALPLFGGKGSQGRRGEGMRDIPDPDVKVKIEKVPSTGDFSYYNYSTPFCNANPTTLLQMHSCLPRSFLPKRMQTSTKVPSRTWGNGWLIWAFPP